MSRPAAKKTNLVLKWSENFEPLNNSNTKRPKNETIKIYNIEQSKAEIDRLKKEGATFEVSDTSNSCKIKIFKKGGRTLTYWYIENTKSDYFLILLNKLKKEILERSDIVNKCEYSKDPKETKYFYFAKAFKNVEQDAGSVYEFDNVFEADISHAYYRAAYVLQFISKDLYTEIITNCTKHDRLRLLGCIATVKLWQRYEKGIFEEGETKKDDLLRAAWFKICNYVDSALLELRDKLGDDFLLYWVDGIYFKHDGLLPDILAECNFFKHIRSVKHKYDLDFKIIQIKKFELINKDNFLEIKIHKPNGDIKRFFPNKKEVKTYSIIGLNDLKKI